MEEEEMKKTKRNNRENSLRMRDEEEYEEKD
jgi:hypothetical protein